MAGTTPIQARSALGNTIKNHPDDHEAIAAARAELAVTLIEREHERLLARARELAEQAPPLPDAQRERLAPILAGGGHAAT